MRLFALILMMMAGSATVEIAAAQGSGTDASLAHMQLDDPQQEAAATDLMKRLRCIQCQGQSIADSDAPIAGAMRSEVRRRIKAGESPAVIEKWLVTRYGEYISFEPPARGAGLILWLVHIILLLAGIGMARGLFAGKPR